MSQLQFPPELVEISERSLLQIEDLPDYAKNPSMEKYGRNEFDELMQERLEDKELEVTMGGKEFYPDDPVKYWEWRFQPENMASHPREYIHEGEESLFVQEDGYSPEGAFVYANPFKQIEVQELEMSGPEMVIYGLNKEESDAYITVYPADGEDVLYGSDTQDDLLI